MTGDLERAVRAALTEALENNGFLMTEEEAADAATPVVVRLIEAHCAPLPLAALDAEARRMVTAAATRAEKAEDRADVAEDKAIIMDELLRHARAERDTAEANLAEEQALHGQMLAERAALEAEMDRRLSEAWAAHVTACARTVAAQAAVEELTDQRGTFAVPVAEWAAMKARAENAEAATERVQALLFYKGRSALPWTDRRRPVADHAYAPPRCPRVGCGVSFYEHDAPSGKPAPEVPDLMEALRQSVAEAKERGSGGTQGGAK